MNRVRHAWLAVLVFVARLSTPAAAQENPNASPAAASNAQTQPQAADASDQQIVVTARRRNEILLDVPVSVTAYSGEQLDRRVPGRTRLVLVAGLRPDPQLHGLLLRLLLQPVHAGPVDPDEPDVGGLPRRVMPAAQQREG